LDDESEVRPAEASQDTAAASAEHTVDDADTQPIEPVAAQAEPTPVIERQPVAEPEPFGVVFRDENGKLIEYRDVYPRSKNSPKADNGEQDIDASERSEPIDGEEAAENETLTRRQKIAGFIGRLGLAVPFEGMGEATRRTYQKLENEIAGSFGVDEIAELSKEERDAIFAKAEKGDESRLRSMGSKVVELASQANLERLKQVDYKQLWARGLERAEQLKTNAHVGLLAGKEAALDFLSNRNDLNERQGINKRNVIAVIGVLAAGAVAYAAYRGISGMGSAGREAANSLNPDDPTASAVGPTPSAAGYNPYTGGSLGSGGLGHQAAEAVPQDVITAPAAPEAPATSGIVSGHKDTMDSSSIWKDIQNTYRTNNNDTAEIWERTKALNPGIDPTRMQRGQSYIMADQFAPTAPSVPKPSTEQLDNFQTLTRGSGTNTASEAVQNILRDNGIGGLSPKQFNSVVNYALQYDAGVHRSMGEAVYAPTNMPDGYHFYYPATDDVIRFLDDLEKAKTSVN